jgi:hypothetical protein
MSRPLGEIPPTKVSLNDETLTSHETRVPDSSNSTRCPWLTCSAAERSLLSTSLSRKLRSTVIVPAPATSKPIVRSNTVTPVILVRRDTRFHESVNCSCIRRQG